MPNPLHIACKNRIQQREPQVQAWAHLRDLQSFPEPESSQGLLWDLPVAVKDIFATRDMPTAWGMSAYAGRWIDDDAAVVEKLRRAGALILGKTVTTELATAAAGNTRNPHNLEHTPGGSSSGSAAAVADRMVPLAIGSQTMGSVLRPAAYCGVFGFKPSYGAISRYGMMPVSNHLDHVGLFARSLEEIDRGLRVLAGPDSRDAASISLTLPPALQPLARSPRLAWIATPWSQALEPEARSRLEAVIATLSRHCDIVPVNLPESWAIAWEETQRLCAHGLFHHHGHLLDAGDIPLSTSLKQWLQRGQQVSHQVYRTALENGDRYREFMQTLFAQYDAILTPVTPGAAPKGLDNTGSPIFCGFWTLCGLPALNLPVGTNGQGLPLGCQLVGSRYQDARLLSVAAWCWPLLKEAFGDLPMPRAGCQWGAKQSE